jgi:hypothetical protein
MVLKSPARSERRLLAAGATLAVFGIAMSTGELGSLAGVLTVGGLLALIVGLHRFGRTGPDGPAPRAASANAGKPKARAKKRTRSARR